MSLSIDKFSIPQMYSNSQGKTSASLVAAHVLILTGCYMGVHGVFTQHSESMFQGIAFATLGTALLGIRRVTNDKSVNADGTSTEPVTVTETKTTTEETKTEVK